MENKDKKARPWDFLNPNTMYVPDKIESFRYEICTNCPLFNTSFKVCTACGCFMQLKVKLAHASCPIDKWKSYSNESGDT